VNNIAAAIKPKPIKLQSGDSQNRVDFRKLYENEKRFSYGLNDKKESYMNSPFIPTNLKQSM
jgi:hypothetical protein